MGMPDISLCSEQLEARLSGKADRHPVCTLRESMSAAADGLGRQDT